MVDTKVNTKLNLVVPKEIPAGLHDGKVLHGITMCPHCRMSYSTNDSDSVYTHTVYHNKLREYQKKYGIYCTKEEVASAVKGAYEIFDNYEDELYLMTAAEMLLLAKFSNYIIANLKINMEPRLEKYRYYAEWIVVNPEYFPESIYEKVKDTWCKDYKLNWAKD